MTLMLLVLALREFPTSSRAAVSNLFVLRYHLAWLGTPVLVFEVGNEVGLFAQRFRLLTSA